MKMNAKVFTLAILGVVTIGSTASAFADGKGYHAKKAVMTISDKPLTSTVVPTDFEAWFAALTEEISPTSSSSSSCAFSPSQIPTK